MNYEQWEQEKQERTPNLKPEHFATGCLTNHDYKESENDTNSEKR